MEGAIIDIDGVLIRGTHAIEGAREALELLLHKNIPFALVTNGGGVPREKKAAQIANIVGVSAAVLAERLVSAHDPIPQLAHLDREQQRVLVLSKSEAHSRGVAHEWGLKNFLVIEDIERRLPMVFPTIDDGKTPLEDLWKEPRVDVICVVATPESWGHSLQLVVDLVLNRGFLYPCKDESIPHPKVYVSNPDVDYRARPPCNRMTTGAWLICLKSLLAEQYGHTLEVVLSGKPHAPIYEMAFETLERLSGGKKLDKSKVIGIGDNPISDVLGANQFGCSSVLVLTGVAKANDPKIPAKYVFDDVKQAFEKLF